MVQHLPVQHVLKYHHACCRLSFWLNNGKCVAGEDVFKYDNEQDRLMDGWPRKIRDAFPGKAGDEPIPNNLDTVFFDIRDKKLYFFKNDMVSTHMYFLAMLE